MSQGSPQDHVRIDLTWKSLSIAVKGQILVKDCSGMCPSGTLYAVMGASGSGKTTLLSAISAQRDKHFAITGSIKANGFPYTSSEFYKFGSFVRQSDILFENLTVRQTLYFTAKLKLDDDEQAQEITQVLLQKFELLKCANSKIGGKLIQKGISGGEKKRLCIALETISKPSVIILDEPTSGLDSDKALKVMRVLKNLCLQGKTIIISIHQPSYRIFELIDCLMVLKSGETVYQGPSQQIEQYMKQLNVSIPLKSNICDSFMFQISDFKAQQHNYTTQLNAKNYQQHLGRQIEDEIEKCESQHHEQIVEKSAKQYQPFCHQYRNLLSREAVLFLRSPLRFGRVIFNAVISFLFIGLVFYMKIKEDRPSVSQVYEFKQIIVFYFIEAQSVCFLNSVSVIASRIYTTAVSIPEELDVYAKESSSETYRPISYFFSKLTIEVPSLVAGTLTYSVGGYWLLGFQNNLLHFLLFCCMMALLAVLGSSLGMLIGMVFLEPRKVSIMLPIAIIPMMLFSGIFNKLNNIPEFIRWIQYLSPFKYGVHMLLLNEYGDEVYRYRYQNGPILSEGSYNYQKDLGISLSLGANCLICGSLAISLYFISYLLLLRVSKKLIVY